MSPVQVRRHGVMLLPESARVILRPFIPIEAAATDAIIARALALPESEVVRELQAVTRGFATRHLEFERLLLEHCARVEGRIKARAALSGPRRLLIGALFSGEYALESAALFNPSIVPHPDQEGLPEGALRVILSLRATGEGHISSIEFRAGVLSAEGELSLAPASPFVTLPKVLPVQRQGCTSELRFSARMDLSERAIFPITRDERNGIEDARFVRCEGGLYCATYTAYDGRNILPRMIETRDFLTFRILALGGDAIRDKGMALFPRQVGGRHAMLSRQDGENLFIMFSGDPHEWSAPRVLLRPAHDWESVKVGNCGSPLETRAGWLVITHGVGPMRRYCIGAVLLDLDDPTRILGRLREPLLEPEGHEREGYVPNVVYSCGSLIHNGRLILPYAMSDKATALASMDLDELLGALV